MAERSLCHALPKIAANLTRLVASEQATQYFHVVFTLPEAISTIAYQNKRQVYGILFRAAAETLRTRRSHSGLIILKSAFELKNML
jgi:hypothetical protein